MKNFPPVGLLRSGLPAATPLRGRVLAALLLLALAGCGSGSHPSDKKLIENFQTHKAAFDQLLRMFLADKGLGRVGEDFTRPENASSVGVNAEGLKAYRRLFERLGLKGGVEGYDEKDIVLFYASAEGLSVSGSSKGYAYCKQRPPLVVEDLDSYKSPGDKSFTAFRHLEGNWYLFFERED